MTGRTAGMLRPVLLGFNVSSGYQTLPSSWHLPYDNTEPTLFARRLWLAFLREVELSGLCGGHVVLPVEVRRVHHGHAPHGPVGTLLIR